ncbi:chaperone protein dnaJ 6-like [Arachis ipaensis]|uniref:chaperone protein dnaJ 6-like n=1 Tax=Arachis ipaensis TaxID=130454 RepID=UPI000A2B33A3|nr:chaperone protein dnaJ 6-like [Arachis ipaensis]
MYKKVTEADIEEFEANYRGSDSEKNDLIDLYNKVTEADIEEFEANYRGSDSEKNDLIDLYKKCRSVCLDWPVCGPKRKTK